MCSQTDHQSPRRRNGAEAPQDMLDKVQAGHAMAASLLFQNGVMPPLAMLLPEDGEAVVLEDTMGDVWQKNAYVMRVQLLALQHQAKTVMFVSEAWAPIIESREDSDRVQEYLETHDSLEDYPGITEIVTVHVETLGVGVLKGLFLMSRESPKRVYLQDFAPERCEWFAEGPTGHDVALRGRFATFLPAKELYDLPNISKSAEFGLQILGQVQGSELVQRYVDIEEPTHH